MTTNKTAKIQFYEGTDEPVVPEIRLTRSKDGTTGQALFLFEKPQALSSITDGEITGMRMICLLYTSPSPRDGLLSRMPYSA